MPRSRVLLVAALAIACQREPPHEQAAPTPQAAPAMPTIRFVEQFERGADASAPLLVVLHGRGDSAENFVALWRGFPAQLEIAAAAAPIPTGDGGEWYHPHPDMTDHELAVAVDAAEARLWPAIRERARGRKLLVAGFSQGAVLSYVLAARHPDEIAYAFPIAGRMPRELLPMPGTRTAPIFALHGTDDPVIGIAEARPAIAAFQAAGRPTELRAYPGVGHTITPEMYRDLVEHIVAALK
ncbi:MAG TPA: dienelactone hydrolase family protein [Kofleriaceae bacterium]|nr:dienelactone hydrolase family protein [Kofleriaceae bacterium]